MDHRILGQFEANQGIQPTYKLYTVKQQITITFCQPHKQPLYTIKLHLYSYTCIRYSGVLGIHSIQTTFVYTIQSNI